MAGFTVKSAVGAERLRCYELVAAYREKIESAMDKRGARSTAEQIKVADAVVKSLLDIEHEIKHPRGKTSSGSDFSLDEIAIAENLIAEQNKNPFEA